MIFLAVAGLFLMLSCTKVYAGDGPFTENRMDVKEFDKISYEIGGKLNYSQGQNTSVSVNTTPAVMEALNIYVEDQTLHISSRTGYKILNQDQLIFTVTDDDTYSLSVSGSGDVNADFDDNYHFEEHYLKISISGNIVADAIHADNNEEMISGSGDVIIDELQTFTTYNKISGSGSISYKNGTVDNAEMKIIGSGDYYTYGLSTNLTNIDISGSGTGHLIDSK